MPNCEDLGMSLDKCMSREQRREEAMEECFEDFEDDADDCMYDCATLDTGDCLRCIPKGLFDYALCKGLAVDYAETYDECEEAFKAWWTCLEEHPYNRG